MLKNFGQSRSAMQNLEATAKRDGEDSGMATLLSQCGLSNRRTCPSCFDLETWSGKPDGLHHLRHECSHPAMIAIRQRLAAYEHERLVRSGPTFHAFPEVACSANELPEERQKVQECTGWRQKNEGTEDHTSKWIIGTTRTNRVTVSPERAGIVQRLWKPPRDWTEATAGDPPVQVVQCSAMF